MPSATTQQLPIRLNRADGTGGLVLIVVLWVFRQRAKNPLLAACSPASTVAVAWTVVANCAAAASMSALEPAATVHLPLRAAAREAATLTKLRVM